MKASLWGLFRTYFWELIFRTNFRLLIYSPLIKALTSDLIKWLVGFWMDAMAWRTGWTPSVIHTQHLCVGVGV